MTEMLERVQQRPGAEGVPLAERARRIRRRVVELCAGPEGGHLGGSLSVVEILTALYFEVLCVDPRDPDWPDRDRLVLSKGHGAIALYATLAERGFLDPAELETYGREGSRLLGHPIRAVPGIESPSGSLGHGPAVAIGFALAARLEASDRRTYVVVGDGELQEGSVWEAVLAAGSLRLGRLFLVVDRNGLQSEAATESVGRLEPLRERFASFGWRAFDVGGHNLAMLAAVLDEPRPDEGAPTAVIAHTVKGKGIGFLEGRTKSHYATLGPRQLERCLAALDGTRNDEGGGR